MKPIDFAAMRRTMLRWYDAHHRDMPWRPAPGKRGNPYHVLVSELMLQQTQVATVVPYFERFIAAWPTVEALAAADEHDVLHLWQGLGYYRRARHLLEAARVVMRDFGGKIPGDVESLLKLPGVGRYTAGAIASIAFGRDEPILDGNVARVLARWAAMREPIDSKTGQQQLWDWAKQMVRRSRRAGDVNQSMMELGALVCTPVAPRCLHCPVSGRCAALEQGVVDELPIKAGKTVVKPVDHEVVAIRRRGEFLFVQRPARGLWAGMWELPTCEQAVDDVAGWAGKRFDLTLKKPMKIGTFTHVTTHRRITFSVWLAECARAAGDHVWHTLDEAGALAMSNAQKRAMQIVRSHITR